MSRDGLEFFRERERERESSGTSIWRIFERRVESVSLRARWMRFVKRDNPEGDFVLRNCIEERKRGGFKTSLLFLSFNPLCYPFESK